MSLPFIYLFLIPSSLVHFLDTANEALSFGIVDSILEKRP